MRMSSIGTVALQSWAEMEHIHSSAFSVSKIINPVLVVDLDGTLLRSDMLYETFWSAFSRDWRSPFSALSAVSNGRAALKRHLAELADVDVSTLPYDAAVIAYIKSWRENGGRTALVTATDQQIANTIADHLGLFDEVHGSEGDLNLKGSIKAEFLRERFGTGGFVYMGDSKADLQVWPYAAKTITVNASQSVRRKAEALGKPTEHLASSDKSWRPYVKALRPHQWLKNLLIFLPMFAAHKFELATLAFSIAAFVAFSLVASGVYVLNDLVDLRSDRNHPRKRERPFASGKLRVAHGSWMALALEAAGCAIAALLGWQFFLILAGYFILTTAYSLNLKRRVIFDVCVLAGLYTIRIVAGGAATGIPLSMWLLAFSIFFFFSLAAVKRQAELVDLAERGELQASGRGYHVNDLPIISMIALASGFVSVLVMALYVNSDDVSRMYPMPSVLWGICCVLLYWVTRMVMMTHRGHMHDDPIVFAAKDRNSQLCMTIVLGFALAGALL